MKLVHTADWHLPTDGRMVIESTANGMGNYFHDLWTEAKSGGSRFATSFYVWWEDASYCAPGHPLDDLTPEEQKLKAAWGLDDGQIRWRRSKQRELRDRFAQEYPEDNVTCFLASGRCCFDTGALMSAQARIAAESAPESVTVLPDREGSISVAPARLLIWKRPEAERLYVIGADVGEGLAGGDASCACVLDKETGEQVAELHGRVPPERFGHLLHALGWHYHMATIAVERNNHGHSTLNTLRHALRYPRLYYHVRYDRTGNSAPVLGWPTDQATKPILVDDLAAAIASGSILIHSPGLIDECLTFVTTDTGAQQAQEGKHDDRVMAAGIAWQARKRGTSRGIAQRPPGW